MNGDGGINILDVVALGYCVINNNCSEITSGRPELDTPDRYLPPKGMSKELHDGILKKLLNAGTDLQQIKSIIDNEPALLNISKSKINKLNKN